MKSWKSTARTNTAMIGAASATLVLLAQACSSGSSGGTSPENDSGGVPDSTSGIDSGLAEASTPLDSGSGNVDSGSGVEDSGSVVDSSTPVDSGTADSGTIVDSSTAVEAEAAAPWSPTTLGSSLVLWLKPSGVHTATCPQNSAANCVSAWEDSSGSGLVATPVVSADPPSASNLDCPYITSTSPCVSFGGTTYGGLQIASTTPSPLDLTGGYAILAIASAQSGATTPVAGGIYNRQNGTGAFAGASLWMPYVGSSAYTASQGFPATQVEYVSNGFAIWQTNLVDNRYHLFVASYDGNTALSIQVDNGAAVTATVPVTTISAKGQPAFVGGNSGQTFYGHIAEVLVINGPISSANLSAAYTYYSNLYGI
jgi:hypothetical protein